MADNVLGVLFQDIANAIRAKTGGADKMAPRDFPTHIASIEVGSGGAEGCVMVTFMNGDIVLFDRPVYVGDDCPDPIVQGRIEAPTKENTVDTVYTFNGWDSSLENITEDKTFFANYSESAREYTVSFYDGDTLLASKKFAYGTIPGYEATKEGYSFEAWEPAITPVVGDVSYYATWSENLTFAGASWSDISNVCESGEASVHFAVGDTRTITAGDYTYVLRIIAIDTDTKADGSGKAGLTVMVDSPATDAMSISANYWGDNSGNIIREWLYTTFSARLSSDMLSVIKPVTKITAYQTSGAQWKSCTTTESFFVPSYAEMCVPSASGHKTAEADGVDYPYLFTTAFNYSSTNRVFATANGTKVQWWTRTAQLNRSGYAIVDTSGKISTSVGTASNQYYVRPCFCI